MHYRYVTGFGKTDHVCTRIEIHFIAYYNCHTQTPYMYRHGDTIATDKKVCFYRQHFANPIKPCRTITEPVGHWEALIRWHVVPNCSTQHLLSSYPPYPLICDICDIAGSIQNKSQNQPVHPVAM